jgi:hypothetical protein
LRAKDQGIFQKNSKKLAIHKLNFP